MVNIAINGFGRIGRTTAKVILDKHPELKIVAINDLADKKTLKHLFKYDSIYGTYLKKELRSSFFSKKNPAKLPWKRLKVDIVLECTGQFKDKSAKTHLRAGAKQVIISAPPKDNKIPVYLPGVNAKDYNPEKDKVVSMGSCTTNALAPIVKVLDKEFGIKAGFLNTVHSYTPSQNLADGFHKDLRRARAAAENIIPTTTGADEAVELALPNLKGKLDGWSLRVPTEAVSIVDFVVQLEKPVIKIRVNQALAKASRSKEMRNVLAVSKEPLVSSDYKESPYSAIVDLNLTQANGNLARVLAWYDNEYGYSSQLANFAEFIAKQLKK